MSEHELVIVIKVGEETGMQLQQATCSCGWRSGIWYAGITHVGDSYGRHVNAVAEGSSIPWMLAPEAGK